MNIISKLIGTLVCISYVIFIMPIVILMTLILPSMAISDAIKIIDTGYTIYSGYLDIFLVIIFLVYISLRFRCIRKIYMIFPSLFEILKYLLIAELFISIGVDILNWIYIDSTRHMLGISLFAISIVLWRVFISIYYRKKPISEIMIQNPEKIKDYSEDLT